MIAGNPNVYVQEADSYAEVLEEYGYEPVLKLIGSTNASLVCTDNKSWEGPKVGTHYPFISFVRCSAQGGT